MSSLGNFGRTLRLIRELKGLGQAELARRAGVGKGQLSKYETGKELPKLDSLVRLLDQLGVTLFSFFYTLHIIDERASSLNEAGAPNLVHLPGLEPLSEILRKGVHEIIGKVIDLYTNLHADLILRSAGMPEEKAPHDGG